MGGFGKREFLIEMLHEQFQVVKITTKEEFELAYQVRVKVFVHEQGIAVEEELDHLDPTCTHFLLYDATISPSKPIGTCRLVPSDTKECHMGRLCILKEYRGKGLGALLSKHFDQEALKQNYSSVAIHAQSYAQEFYQRLGYAKTDTPPFLEVGIEHIHMIKNLQ
jgi:predicted GNAT family N-acyltransferase